MFPQVQRHLQLRLEAQGKYLQDVLEKAHESLGRENSGSSGLEAAKVQLSDLVCQVSTQCLNSAFSGMKELSDLCLKQVKADGSVDSCLTSCDGTMRDQELYQNPIGLKYINFTAPTEPRNRIDNKESAKYLAENTFVTETNLHSLSMSIGLQGGEWSWKGGDQNDSTKAERRKSSPDLELPLLSTRFDLNTDDENSVASRCKQLDLNGFSWS